MSRARPLVAVVTFFVASGACIPIAVAQTAKAGAKAPTPKSSSVLKTVPLTDVQAPAGNSLTDSPYQNGPPPITGGFTDTSQGGKKTSGDPLAVPPGAASTPAAGSR